MIIQWSTNIYDSDGDEVEKCVLLHVEDNTILKFKTLEEMQEFAERILSWLPEIRETNPEA